MIVFFILLMFIMYVSLGILEFIRGYKGVFIFCIVSVDDGVFVFDIFYNLVDELIGVFGGCVDGDEFEGVEWLRYCVCCIWIRFGMFVWLKGLMCYIVKSDR